MPPRAKKVNRQKPSNSIHKEKRTEDEKENMFLDKLLKEKKSDLTSITLQSREIKAERAPLSPQKQKLKQKEVGFWSRKLQELELQKDVGSDDKYLTYEFNGNDECMSHQRKKKSKQKVEVSKRKKVALPKCNKLPSLHQNLLKKTKKITESEKKIKQLHQTSLFKERIMLSKEREQLAGRGKEFTFSTGMPSLGITSTPVLNKENLIGASTFLFLSPIIEEDAGCCSANDGRTPIKKRAIQGPVVTRGQETELQKISCRRVLRSGRVLNI